MTKSIIVALSLLALGSTAGMAQGLTSQEQAACRPDAMKLCSANIGKPADMRACLVTNKDSLSPDCRKVVEAHGG